MNGCENQSKKWACEDDNHVNAGIIGFADQQLQAKTCEQDVCQFGPPDLLTQLYLDSQ